MNNCDVVNVHKRLVIIGASGHGKVVADTAIKMGTYNDIVFLDDNTSIHSCMCIPIVGRSDDIPFYIKDSDFFVAIGNAETRQRIFEKLKKSGAAIATLIHPDAVIGTNVKIGKGTVVMAGAVINSETEIGEGCIINTSSSVDHVCLICDYVHISVGAHVAGTVVIGSRTWLGIGAVISNNLSIVSDCVIGAGAVVVKSITESGTYIGIPASQMEIGK